MDAKPRVIIVDDDRETREMLALALESRGFDVSQAANGLRLISNLHVDHPDVIVLDVTMSWIDGFELCRALKRNEEFQEIPVVYVSARATPQDVKQGLEAGAEAYFIKPVDLPALTSKLMALVAKKASR